MFGLDVATQFQNQCHFTGWYLVHYNYSFTIYILIEVRYDHLDLDHFLVFPWETLHYCDEWRNSIERYIV